MGIIWRSTMPFLITMAALVLIVHTAEEDLESEYRHDLRPRILDTKTSNYDQTRRAMEVEPVMQHTRIDKWNDKHLDELPKRRRPGRKRKRRPEISSSEDFGPQERYPFPEEPPRPYIDVNSHGAHLTTEMPMRRRKKPDARPIRWTDESVDFEVPLRRRSQRRKRPVLESWPELSEFNGYRPENKLHEEVQKHNEYNDDKKEPFEEVSNVREEIEKTITDQQHEQEPIQSFAEIYDEREEQTQYKKKQTKEDKSLSEFSAEVISSEQRKNLDTDEENVRYKDTEQSLGTRNEHEKAQKNRANPALSLKDILKKSNGTSLSEILQQHNLSLADLLHGKEKAVSLFKSQRSVKQQNEHDSTKTTQKLSETKPNESIKDDLSKNDSEEKELVHLKIMRALEDVTTDATECPTTTEQETTAKDEHYSTTTMKSVEDKVPKIVTHPIGVRKKLRIRPMLNNTFKAQLTRDLVTLNSRKYSHHRRNITKLSDWKDVFPIINQNDTSDDNTVILESETTTNSNIQDDTTINIESETDSNIHLELHANQSKFNDVNMDIIVVTPTSVTNKIERTKNLTDKLPVISMPRPTALSSGLRRQAFNNRLKRKRLKQKNSTTEPPQDDIIKHLLGMGDLVSSSEFIARTQEPKDEDENSSEYTTLEDFITTESTSKSENDFISHTKTTSVKTSTTPIPSVATTEETAKIEIEEILNDTQTSARLSKILMERNMTLNELLEHRERGSSHVHLADIFHNASREPNPEPEPFLSKSVIEPISKETYPLRALLEANIHDTTAKPTTIDPAMIRINHVNIPVVMDFRNNVNENAENMGIISLFNNYTKSRSKNTIKKDSEGRPYETSVIVVNNTYSNDPSNTARESRTLIENMDDVVSWNEIFSLMRRNQKTEIGNIGHAEVTTHKQFSLDEDIDGDGMIVLEDLQHFKDFDSNIAPSSDEKLEAGVYGKTELPPTEINVHERIPSQTKSVTVATASIAGLAMVLFLITYAVFKWREQRLNIRKKSSFCDDRIPTPVFENRKCLKNSNSMRSISPMLQTSNIYTLNTLDSKGGNESPDYMWDTLRKPFQ